MILKGCKNASYVILILLNIFIAFTGSASVLLAADAIPKPCRFVQDRFAIGFGIDPPLDKHADATYRGIADANFTMIVGSSGGTNQKAIKKQLDLCKKYKLKAVLAIPGMAPEEMPKSSECWGYALSDEPSASDFPVLRKQVDAVRRARPGMLALINLFPNYASEKQLGTSTYEEYVDRFVKEVDVDVLCMDHYPIFRPDRPDGRDNYCNNLEVMRKLSLEADIPFWNFFNNIPFGPHTDPTEDQLRWQVYASLTYGAKGVHWFCYYTPVGQEFPKGGGIITRDGHRTRHWEQARQINAEVMNMGPTLMKLSCTEVRRITPTSISAEVLKGSPIRNISRDAIDPPNDYLIGMFQHKDGRRAVMVMNYHFAYTAWPTVEFDVPMEHVKEVSKKTGGEVALRDDSPEMPGVQLSLDAGEGRLFLLPAK